MACEICGEKPSWCECTQEAREFHSLRESMSEEQSEVLEKLDEIIRLLGLLVEIESSR